MKHTRKFKKAAIIMLIFALLFGNVAEFSFAEDNSSAAGTREETVTPPTTKKELTPNGDGTYTLSLSVVGRSESSSESNKADVVVVFDKSGSMKEDQYGHKPGAGNYSGPSRLAVAKEAVNSLAEQLLSNNTAEDPDRVQLSLVTFSNTASVAVTQTTDLTNYKNRVNGITADGGTNWEDALKKAHAIPTREGATKYVIFVSDGNPTFRNTQGGDDGWIWTPVEDQQHGSYPYYYGSGNSDNNGKNFKYALVEAKKIVKSGANLYSIGAFGNATNMQNLATQSGAPASNYYDATNQAALNAAFTNIINEITNSLGYKNVKVNDGVTAFTSVLVNNADDFKYTRSGGSYGTNQAWAAAPDATFDGSSVKWDLGDMQLENGVTYTVSFTVWPKQDAYDLVADLNNGIKKYEDLTDDQKAQIVALAGGGYGLKTNTEAGISYTQIKTTTTKVKPEGFAEGQPAADGFTYTYDPDTGIYTGTKETSGKSDITNPDPMALTGTTMKVEKEWIGYNPPVDEIKFKLFKDGEDTDTIITINKGNDWEADAHIAPGLMKRDGTVLEKGHEYTLKEIDGDYHFDFETKTVHPMILDDKIVDKNANNSAISSIKGTNVKRSSLNITKKVVDNGVSATADPDTLFTYKIKITNEVVLEADKTVWFSIGANGSPTVVEDRVTGATAEIKDGTPTGYYYAPSGTEVTVKIKKNENIYFVNLPIGSKYEIEEVDLATGFSNTAISDENGIVALPKTTGQIEKSNTTYNVEYTNQFDAVTLKDNTALKVTKKVTGRDAREAFEFTLSPDADAIAAMRRGDFTMASNPLTAKTSADIKKDQSEEVSFEGITFYKEGTYTFIADEKTETTAGGWAYDDSTHNIIVTVAKGTDGKLVATVQGNNPEFVNEYKVSSTTVKIPVKKVLTVPEGLTGTDIKGKFKFELTAAEGTPMPAVTEIVNPDANGGVASFDAITYNAEGTYEYTVAESGTAPGVTNDAEASKKVTVKVTDNGDGTLTAVADSTTEKPLTFTNVYAVSSIEASIPVKKTLSVPEGLTAPDITGKFTFEIAAAEGTPMPAVTKIVNPAADGGVVTFENIKFEKPGTYIYTIAESGDVAGITNDTTSSKTVTVTVTDNGDGTMAAVVSATTDKPLEFTNSYSVKPTTAVIKANKVLKNAKLAAGAFSFELKAEDAAPMPASDKATNDADGSVTFGKISYNMPGMYVYKLKETKGEATFYEYDEKEYTVTVTVKDNSDGTLTATVEGDGTSAIFTNTYKVEGNVALISAKKLVNGQAASKNIFKFEITADDGGNLPAETTVTNDGGSISFGPIKYTESIFVEPELERAAEVPAASDAELTSTEAEPQGDDTVAEDSATVEETRATEEPRSKKFHYTIKELPGNAPGYTYDTDMEVHVTVTVTDNGDGTLKTEVEYGEDVSFKNKYAAEGNVVISAKKTLEGKDLAAEQFVFELFEGDERISTATNDESGAIVFELEYDHTMAGEHRYSMRELVETPMDGYTYDSSVKNVIVKVTDNGDGTMSAEVTNDGDMTFKNVYKPLPTQIMLTAKKVLKGRTLVAGAFSFQITDIDGKVVSTATNGADGNIAFAPIPIVEAGTYTLTATELNKGEKGMTYDATKFVYNVVVEDVEGKLTVKEVKVENAPGGVIFNNEYKEESKPQTGDSGIGMYALIGLFAAAAFAAITARKKLS